jgi:hypothetical protein
MHGHILFPSFWTEELSIHSIEIRPSVHRVHTKGYGTSFGNKDGGVAVGPATSRQNSRTDSRSCVDRDRRI